MSLVAWWPLNGNLKDNGPHGYDLYPECYVYGDVDGDGKITETDASMPTEYYTGHIDLTPEQIERADVSLDGKITARDSSMLLAYVHNTNRKEPIGRPIWSQPRFEPVWGEGKTGKAFYITGNYERADANLIDLKGKKEMSATLWVKVDSITNSFNDLITFTLSKPDGSSTHLRLESVKSGTDYCYLNWFANNYYWNDGGLSGNTCKVFLGEWNHIAFSITEKTSSWYLNGKLLCTRTHHYSNSNEIFQTGNVSIGCQRYELSYHTGAICNVKVYDHILTRSEINADYKQPILHYSFENPYVEPTTNLESGTTLVNDNGTAMITATGSATLPGESKAYPYYVTKPFNVGKLWHGVAPKTISGKPGAYYTWSIDIYSTSDITYLIDTNVTADNYGGNDAALDPIRGEFHQVHNRGTPGIILSKTWTRVYVTLKVKNDAVNPKVWNTFVVWEIPGGAEQTTIYYRNSQVEERYYNTPYTPLSREAGQIKDVSGMGNHSIVEDEDEDESLIPNWNPDDCAIGSYSVDMRDNNKLIKIPNTFYYDGSFTDLNEFSISIWFKPHEDQEILDKCQGYRNLFSNNYYNTVLLWMSYATEGSSYWVYYPLVHNDGTASQGYLKYGGYLIKKDQWHLMTYTFKNGVSTLYANGKKVVTKDDSATGTKIRFYHSEFFWRYYIGRSKYLIDNSADNAWNSTFNASIDDFRIYPVALNDKDVLDLYQMKAKVDSDGNLFTNQLVETKNNLFKGFEHITTMGWYGGGSYSWNYENGIFTITCTTATNNPSQNGPYIQNAYYGGALSTNRWFRYSLWVKLPLEGNWLIKEERMAGSVSHYYANKWYHVEAVSQAVNGTVNFIFYHYGGIIPAGAEIQIKDLEIQRLDKEDFYYVEKMNKALSSITDPIIVEKEGAKWLKVFHHNSKNKTVFFTDEAEALDIQTEDKYSILNQLGNFRGPDGRFEFLLEYPEQHPGKFNRWKQEDDPTQITEVINSSATVDNNPVKAKGYEGIHIDWQGEYWGGLLKHIHTNDGVTVTTFIDGSVGHVDWYYAIGTYYKNWQGGAIPGPVTSGNATDSSESVAECTITTSVDLYVRIDYTADRHNSSVTKNGQFKTFELSEIDDKDIETNHTIIKYGREWHRVFHHNIGPNKDQWFKNEAEALHCNSKYKYSILDQLEDFRGADGKFEFLLEYPLDLPGQYNHWRQTDNPATVVETTTQATGYEAIHIDWTTRKWNGLLKSTVPAGSAVSVRTLIDGGGALDNWYYAIGCYNNDPNDWNNALPGPNNTSNNTMHEVNLYVASDINYIGATIVDKYGAEWLRVFHHNSQNGTVLFANEEEVLHCIGDPNKYSILRRLENFRGKDGKFEFLLEYPDDFNGEYARWKQSNNPLDDYTTYDGTYSEELRVEGYEEIHNSWSASSRRFQGLLRSQMTTTTLLDGIVGTNWFYAIGAYNVWNNEGDPKPKGIPGPHEVLPVYGDIELYVRIDNIDNRNKIFKLQKRKTSTKEIIEI